MGAVVNVTFCMEWMPSYRRHFYEMLEPKLRDLGVSMTVIHGLPPASRSQRRDHSEPNWATLIENRIFHIGGSELTWQPVWQEAKKADLIVLQQEAAHLFNYFAMAKRRLGGPRVALWGHGENPDPAAANRVAEGLKKRTTPWADWCFAYTSRSVKVFESLGVDPEHITMVNNSRSHDNLRFRPEDASDEMQQLCEEVSNRSRHVGWMSSALDESKRLSFLVEVLDAIRLRVPDFEFFLLGRGTDEKVVFDAAESRPWLHTVGARFGADKVALGNIASLMVHPGLLGLHVIDSFAFETPIITTEFISHSHEIDYLVNGENAMILRAEASPADLAVVAQQVLFEPDRLNQLKVNCRTSGEMFSLESMTDRFAEGLLEALGRQHSTHA